MLSYLIVFCFVLTGCFCEDITKSEYVTDLNAGNIEEFSSNSPFMVTMFFAPWCGHCKNLMPHFEKVCEDIIENVDKDAICGRVDCTANAAVCDSHNLKGYPTIKMFKNGNYCEYLGERTREAIYRWVRLVVNASKIMDNAEEIKDILNDSYTLVGYFDKDDEKMSMLDRLSCSQSAVKLIKIVDSELAKSVGIDEKNTLSLFDNGKFVKKLEFKPNESEIRTDLWFATTPLVPSYSHDLSSIIFTEGVKSYLAFIYDCDETYNKHFDTLKNVAQSQQSEGLRVFSVNGSILDHKNVLDFFSVKKLPQIVFYDDSIREYFHYKNADINHDLLVDFYKGCINGSIEKFIKRQPIPEDWDDKPVKILVYDNFESAFEKYKKGIVLFYAPWCGHCEALMPTWDQLAENFEKRFPDLFVAKVDHTQNEIDGITVNAYPTIYIFPSRDKPIKFEGERTFKAVEAFVLQHLIDDDESIKKSRPADDEL